MIYNIRESITKNSWKYAVPGGLIAAFLVVLQSDDPVSPTLNFFPVFVAGLIGGVLIVAESSEANSVGLRTGLIGSLPVLIYALGALSLIPGYDQPMVASGVQAVIILIGTVLAVVLIAVFGMIGSRFGYWLSAKIGTDRRPATAR